MARATFPGDRDFGQGLSFGPACLHGLLTTTRCQGFTCSKTGSAFLHFCQIAKPSSFDRQERPVLSHTVRPHNRPLRIPTHTQRRQQSPCPPCLCGEFKFNPERQRRFVFFVFLAPEVPHEGTNRIACERLLPKSTEQEAPAHAPVPSPRCDPTLRLSPRRLTRPARTPTAPPAPASGTPPGIRSRSARSSGPNRGSTAATRTPVGCRPARAKCPAQSGRR